MQLDLKLVCAFFSERKCITGIIFIENKFFFFERTVT